MLNKIKEKKDSLILMGVCGVVILFGGVAHLVAWAGFAWGMWQIVQKED
jgi:hypothetical protein